MKFSISLPRMERVVFIIPTNNIFMLGWQARNSLPLRGGCTSYWIYWRWAKGSSVCLSYTITECWNHRVLPPHFIWPMDNSVALKWGPILAFLSAWRRQLQGDVRAFSSCKRAGERLFTMVWSDRARGDSFKLKKGWFRLDLRMSCCKRVPKQWHKWSICGII